MTNQFIEGNLATKSQKAFCFTPNQFYNTRNRFRFKMKLKIKNLIFQNSYQTELNPSKIA